MTPSLQSHAKRQAKRQARKTHIVGVNFKSLRLSSDGACVHSALLTRLATACSAWSKAELEDVIEKGSEPGKSSLGLFRRDLPESDKGAQLMMLAIAADATGKSLPKFSRPHAVVLQLEIAQGFPIQELLPQMSKQQI